MSYENYKQGDRVMYRGAEAVVVDGNWKGHGTVEITTGVGGATEVVERFQLKRAPGAAQSARESLPATVPPNTTPGAFGKPGVRPSPGELEATREQTGR